MSFNKIIIVGNLGRDPELRYTPQGNAVCSFSMASNEKRRDKSGEMQNIATWFRITLWGHQAENASKYLTKGSPVYIEGRLRVEEWTDRDNNNRHTLEVNATDMHFIGGGRGEGGGGDYGHHEDEPQYTGSAPSTPAAAASSATPPALSGAAAASGAPAPASAPASDDDIPF